MNDKKNVELIHDKKSQNFAYNFVPIWQRFLFLDVCFANKLRCRRVVLQGSRQVITVAEVEITFQVNVVEYSQITLLQWMRLLR